MKKLILVLVIISPFLVNSQILSYKIVLDTLESVGIGNRNESGEKQGKWEYYRIENFLKVFDNGFVDTVVEKEKICVGNYVDGKKVGEWKYFMNEKEAPSIFFEGTISADPLYTLIYHNDSSITYKDICKEFRYNKDSSFISGTYKVGIYTKNECVLNVKCVKLNNDFKCRITQGERLIIDCDYFDLDFYLTKLTLGGFDKELKENTR